MRVSRLQEEATSGLRLRRASLPNSADELLDGVVKAGGRTALLDHLGPFAAEEALDRRPPERPNVIGRRSRIPRIAQDVGLRRERALTDHFEIKLLVAAEGQEACRLPPGVELRGAA